MKTMKKLAAVALSLVLLLALAAPAFAVEDANQGSITITGSAVGQTYHIYKLLDLKSYTDETPDSDNDHLDGQYLYTVNSDWATFFAGPGLEFVEVNEGGAEKYVTWKSGADVEKLAKDAKDWATQKGVNYLQEKASGNDGTVTFTDLALGYYLIDSTVGTTCFLDTTNPDVTIQEKNELPTMTKYIVDGENDEATRITADFGQTIIFRFKVLVPASLKENTEKTITITDTMSEYLTNATLVAPDSGVDMAVAGNVLTFTIDAATVATAATNGSMEIRYTAELTGNAPLASEEITNSAKLTFDGKTGVDSVVNVYTYEIDIFKYRNGGAGEEEKVALKDADFVLMKGDEYYKLDGGKVSWVADENEATKVTSTDTADGESTFNVVFAGLANGNYTIHEVKAPDGYNRAADTPITINSANGKAEIVNLTGAELPSTGGIGTTIFYVVGGLLVAGAVILLVTRKRAGEQE